MTVETAAVPPEPPRAPTPAPARPEPLASPATRAPATRAPVAPRRRRARAPWSVVARRLTKYAAVVALVALALIGLLSVTRGTPVEYVIARGDAAGPPAPGDSLFTRTMELYTGVPLHPGNRVQVLENGNGTYPLLWRDLRTCRRTVTVQMYFAKPGRVADTMAATLGECARRGARVLLLLDGFGAQTLQRSGPTGCAARASRWRGCGSSAGTPCTRCSSGRTRAWWWSTGAWATRAASAWPTTGWARGASPRSGARPTCASRGRRWRSSRRRSPPRGPRPPASCSRARRSTPTPRSTRSRPTR
jgi:hypothetical protein